MNHAFLRYVRHDDVDRYLTCGWIFVCPLAFPHGQYSCLMQMCACMAEKMGETVH